MKRQIIRRINTSIPHEPVPINKYNQQRSTFNFKPKRTQGLIYNPPAAIIKPYMQTPNLFLPDHDPRKQIANVNKLSSDIIEQMPIIRQYKTFEQKSKEDSITIEQLNKIRQIRKTNPEQFDVKEISKQFNIEISKLIYFLNGEKKKKSKNDVNFTIDAKYEKPGYLLERQKRKQMWLRNEY